MTRATCLAALFLAFAPPLPAQEPAPDYAEWVRACARLPPNRELRGRAPDNALLPLRGFAGLDRALDAHRDGERAGPLGQLRAWLGPPPDAATFFDATRSWYADPAVPFQPFAQKLVLPPDAAAVVLGDLHGDVRSLLKLLDELQRRKWLDGFRLTGGNRHLIVLGDYCDRGAYGAEVLYTLLRLKVENPRRVHLVRGNHEDPALIARYGFLDELRVKYGQSANVTKLIRAYDLLPAVLYVGDGRDFLQLCHGGLEPGYDPRALLAAPGEVRYQLLGELRQKAYHAAHPGWLGDDPAAAFVAGRFLRDFTPQAPTRPAPLGFLWNDFTVLADEPALGYDRALVFGAGPTRHVLQQASTDAVRLRAVLRAHQHSPSPTPLMARLVAHDGLYRHWQADGAAPQGDSRPIPDGSVWTFNVSSDSTYGAGVGFDFVTAGVLTLGREFADWRLTVLKLRVF